MKRFEGYLWAILAICMLVGSVYIIYKVNTTPDDGKTYELDFRASP
tara:strand:+ start:403 stop:540 length:138 start_codon:yes stop_codon:yes gene_type:complete